MLDATDPFVLFDAWLAEAVDHEPDVPNAMQLGTVGTDGAPRVRTVLLKGHGPEGFVFYTNLASRKATDLGHEARAALTFHWKSLQRQVHVLGTAQPVDDAEADAYFATRHRGSQLGAWASAQSAVIDPPEALRERLARETARFEGAEVPRPPFWSGFRVVPHELEFWQGRPDRLHDRLQFVAHEGDWQRAVLYP